MDKTLLTFAKARTTTVLYGSLEFFRFSTSSNKTSKALADKIHQSNIRNNVFSQAIETGLRQSPATKVFGFYNRRTFSEHLGHYSLPDNKNNSSSVSLGFTLSRNILLELLPKNSHLGVFTRKQLTQAVALTGPHNICLNNLFKDQETLELAKHIKVSEMLINSPEELQKIHQVHPSANYIWEFDKVDLSYVEGLLAMLFKYNVPLYGVKFNSDLADDNRALLANISRALQKSRQMFSAPKKVIIDTQLCDLQDLLVSLKESDLLRKHAANVTVEVNDLNTNNYVRCATRIIGKKAHGYVFNTEAEQFLCHEELLRLNSQLYKVGDWVMFRPVNSGLLQTEDAASGAVNLMHVNEWIEETHNSVVART